MKSVIAEILPLALIVTISPINIIAAILLLFSKRPLLNASSYLAGFIVGVVAVIGGIVALAGILDHSPSSGQSRGVAIFKLALGAYLLVVAVRRFRGRPAAGEDAPFPKWMNGITEFSPGKSLGTGIVVGALNPKNIVVGLAAALTIASAALPAGQAVGVTAIYVFIAILGVAAPILVVLFLGDKAQGVLDGWKAWLAHNNPTVMAVLFLVFGVFLISQGINGA